MLGAFLQVPGTVLVACGLLQSSPQGRLGRTVHALVVLDLWAAVAVVALLQAVIEQAQVFLHLLGLVDGVRVQDLWDKELGSYQHRRPGGIVTGPKEVATSVTSPQQAFWEGVFDWRLRVAFLRQKALKRPSPSLCRASHTLWEQP